MHRTALHNLVLFLLLFFALICPNCVTLTVSTAQAGRDQSDSGSPVSVLRRRGPSSGVPWRVDTPSGCSDGTGLPSFRREHCWRPTPAGNGTRRPGWPTPAATSNATWPGQSTLRHTRPTNPTAVFFPILVMISIASVLAWRWHRGSRRNLAASRTHLVAVADFGQQTIKFISTSPKSGATLHDLRGRG